MNLRNDTRQNIQMELDFLSSPAGEAREAGREETESRPTMNDPESPASTNRLMEEVCERENLKEALRRVKANKGSPGVDGMTVGGITDYLKQHWPARGVGSVYAGLAHLFRLLRNARGAEIPHSLGPAAASGCPLAAVENCSSSEGGADGTGGACAAGE